MNHRYQPQPIPEGKEWVNEVCACGQLRRRFANGKIVYQHPDGLLKSTMPPRCQASGDEKREFVGLPIGRSKAKKGPDPRAVVESGRVLELEDTACKITTTPAGMLASDNRVFLGIVGHLSEPDARLKDAYVIINLLYEEMVTAGLRTPGRQMAGRLLYSAGYSETVKKLENQ